MGTVAVLALQGAFAEHMAMLKRLGADCFEIRARRDLNRPFDALILPGGESTAMGRLLQDLELLAPLKSRIEAGLPVLGTCAGLILLARQVEGGAPCLGTMNLTARRNAYGRQLGSFTTYEVFSGAGEISMTFIRAPYIAGMGPEVEVLAHVGDRVVAARQGNQIAVAFHPELTGCTAVHEMLLGLCV